MKKHIRLLEEANLVATEKVGRARRCTLVPYALDGISTWLQRLDRFAKVVERTKDGMTRDPLSSGADDPRSSRKSTEPEEVPSDDRNGL
jgi:hypothetical protein